MIERLRIVLSETKEMLEAGSIVVVEESRLRVRRLPLREENKKSKMTVTRSVTI
jgi:hypothetical protein